MGFFLKPERSGNISSVLRHVLLVICPEYEDVYGVEHGVTSITFAAQPIIMTQRHDEERVYDLDTHTSAAGHVECFLVAELLIGNSCLS